MHIWNKATDLNILRKNFVRICIPVTNFIHSIWAVRKEGHKLYWTNTNPNKQLYPSVQTGNQFYQNSDETNCKAYPPICVQFFRFTQVAHRNKTVWELQNREKKSGHTRGKRMYSKLQLENLAARNHVDIVGPANQTGCIMLRVGNFAD
jgi:hypothetical protein